MGNGFEGAHAVFPRQLLVSDAIYALGLAQNERDFFDFWRRLLIRRALPAVVLADPR